MIRIVKVSIALLVLLLVGCAGGLRDSGSTPSEAPKGLKDGRQLRIRILQPWAHLDSYAQDFEECSFLVAVEMTNTGAGDIKLDRRLLQNPYVLTIVDSHGKSVRRASFEPPAHFVGDSHTVIVLPGASHQVVVEVAPLAGDGLLNPPYYLKPKYLGRLWDTPIDFFDAEVEADVQTLVIPTR